MRDVSSENLRNVAFIGHGQAGKTSLVSALLYDAKMVNRLGRVDQGNTVTDYDEEAIARKISVQSALAYAYRDKYKINIIDTPGFHNFIWEARLALMAVETGVVTVCAQEGVQVQTEKAFAFVNELSKPALFVINKMKKELADWERTLGALVDAFGKNVVAVHQPLGKGPAFNGVVDLVTLKAYGYGEDDKGDFKEVPVPTELQAEVKKRREALIEKVAETDEKLMEKYFEQGDLGVEEIVSGLKNGIRQRTIFPVLVADATTNIGVPQLIDFIIQFCPSPLEAAAGPMTLDKSAPFAGWVFKTFSDPFTGKISVVRVFAGVFKPDTFYLNSTRGSDERVAGLFLLQGKTQESAGEVRSGDIVAVTKLKETQTGDTLTVKGGKIRFPDTPFPVPAISFAIEPKAKQDEGKISNALQRIMEEDPSLRTSRDIQTKQQIISGNGQLHVELVVGKLKKRYGVEVTMTPPKIAYQETILGKADVEHKYKKQSGGRGQYGHVFAKMEPLPRGTGFQFEETLFGTSIPRNYVPAVEKGVLEAKQTGVLAGYPVVDFKFNLYDGSYHEVDSSDMAFKIAASMAFKKGMKQAKPALLEPIMKVSVFIPQEFMGEINGNLSGRRGRIQGMETKGKNHVVKALVPMVEMLDFEPQLTSITGGRGSYSMEFSHYEEVPAQQQKRIIDEAVKAGRVKEEEE